MTLTQNLLYLLLLYAVLDHNNNLSLTTGLVIAFAIMLFNCYYGKRCCNNEVSQNSNSFSFLNGTL